MFEILAIAVPVGMASLGGFIHMQLKTAAASQELIGLRELLQEKFLHVESRFNEADRRLERIERSMNGHLVKD